ITARFHVQTQAGVQQLGQLIFGYNSANEKLEVVYLRVRKPDGTVVNASADNFQDVPSQIEREAPSYTDYRERHVTVAALRPGDTLEYQIKTQIFSPLIPKHFWFEHTFNKEIISLDEQFEVNLPKDREVKLKNKPDFAPKITEQGDRKIYRWTSNYLKRESDEELKKKKRRQAREDYVPDIQLTTFHDWNELGSWYASLQKTQMDASPTLRAKVADLTRDLKTDEDKITAIYDFVAQEYRYVSLSFGVGRYQPHTAEDIFANKYGDCKDKHTLFSTMMKAAGYTVQPVLIGSSRKLDPDVPSPSQFDHVISLIQKKSADGKPEDVLWADTTTEIAPFGLLSYNIRKKKALLAALDGPSRLVETPADPPFPGKQDFTLEGSVSDLGKLKATVKGVFRGDTELAMRAVFRSVPQNKWKEVGQYVAYTSGIGGEVSEVKVENLTNTHVPLQISFEVSRPNFLLWSNKTSELELPLPRVGLSSGGRDDDETGDATKDDSDDDADDDAKVTASTKTEPKVEKPIDLGSPYDLKITLKLALPAGYKLRTPVPISVKRDYAEYGSKYKVDGQTLTAERTMSTKMREIPPTRRADYLAFSRSVRADEQQKMHVESLNAASGTPELPKDIKTEELLDSARDAMQNQNYKVALSLLTRAAEKEPKNKQIWNMLGDAHMGLREFTQAEEAYRKQIANNAFDEFAYNNLARALWNQRRLEDAIQPYQKQLEINPLDRNAHASLGELYLELKKYPEAVEENEKAVSLDAENGFLHANLGRAYLGMKRDKEAIESFDKALELQPNPLLWNNIAYELANNGSNLDRAQQYAESAVSSVASSLRNVSVDRLSMRDMAGVMALGSYWDTLGWVAFKRGDIEKAEKYIRASWYLTQGGEVGDHLAQISEKKGRKDDAVRLYAEALSGNRPVNETKDRLAALIGDKKKTSDIVEMHRADLSKERTYSLGKLLNKSVTADFLVVLSPGKVEGVKFISGSDELKSYSAKLDALNFGNIFPDETPTKIVRRGNVSCTASSGECIFVLMQPETITSVD
ncbi:MAG: Tetratricopeptide repeat protein, partial [Acidobacteriaceae bacterium]|nr:Tetratricopeptide repeat protein [Acidobacteriaceae bacterium]